MKKFLAIFFIVGICFIFFSQKNLSWAQLCDYGTYCGEASNCPGNARCCVLEGAYGSNACSASGASCHTWEENCQSGGITCSATNPCPQSGVSNSCPSGQCALPYCSNGQCIDYCYIPTPPETCGGGGGGGNPTPTPVAGCNANCTVDGECNNLAGQYCFNSSDGPDATGTCRLQSDWYNPACTPCQNSIWSGGYLNDSTADFECSNTSFSWRPPDVNPATIIYNYRTPIVGDALGIWTHSNYVRYIGGGAPNSAYGYEGWWGSHVGTSASPLGVGETVQFSGRYQVAMNTFGGTARLDIGYFNGGTWLTSASSPPSLNMTPTSPGEWRSFTFEDTVTAQKATANMLAPAVVFHGTSSEIRMYFDKLVLWHYQACTTPGIPGNQAVTYTPACGGTSINPTFSWNESTGATSYNFYITPVTEARCTANGGSWEIPTPISPYSRCNIALGNVLTTQFNGLSTGGSYDWGVQAVGSNPGCPSSSYGNNPALNIPAFTCQIQARALRVSSTSSCDITTVGGTTTGTINGAFSEGVTGATVRASTGALQYDLALPSNQAYTALTSVSSGSYSMSPLNTPAGYSFALACPTGTPQIIPTVGNPNIVFQYDIGYTTANAWYQTVGGSTHANGSLSDILPAGLRYLTNLETYLYGGLVSHTGLVNFGTSYPTAADALPNGFLLQDAAHTKTVPSYYNFYSSRIGVSSLPTISSGATIPSAGFYLSSTSDLTIGNWTVTSGNKIIVFVPGNLVITDNIDVEPGGFLAFIVNGDININGGLSVLEGVYITDSTFRTIYLSGQPQLLAEGTFVANSFSLNRDLGTTNQTTPAEKFTYRADLWINSPDVLKDFDIQWQEVAP